MLEFPWIEVSFRGVTATDMQDELTNMTLPFLLVCEETSLPSFVVFFDLASLDFYFLFFLFLLFLFFFFPSRIDKRHVPTAVRSSHRLTAFTRPACPPLH